MFPCLSSAVDHSPKWNGNTLTYNLPETEEASFYANDQFGYCRWGVLQSEDTNVLVTLGFTRLTARPYSNETKALFLSGSLTALQRLQFPTAAVWTSPSGSVDGYFSALSTASYVALFRYLYFEPFLLSTESDGSEPRLKSSARKLIVLIHGWNPNSNEDSYAQGNSSQFASLVAKLKQQLGAPDASDWKLVKYRWERDADTGGKVSFSAAAHGTRAAVIAHLHGQHLGQLLSETCKDLQSVHFIAHSAGSWAARAAAKYLAQNAGITVQVTLLDPFIPDAAIGVGRTALTVGRMNELGQLGVHVSQLENDYSWDVLTTLGTENTFTWRAADIPAFPISYLSAFNTYDSHSAPIQFYADTVASTVKGEAVPPDLANAPYYATNSTLLGWWRSQFWNEPIVVQQPESKTINSGEAATFSVYPNTRRARFGNADAAGLSIQWQKDGVNISGATSTTLTITSAAAASVGEYVALVSNIAGRTTSKPATLTVSGATVAGPTIAQQPADQTMTEGQTATFGVVATGSGTLTYKWRRNGADISGATTANYATSPVSLANDGYTYQVVITDSQGTKNSRIATLNVTPQAIVDDHGNSSTTATALTSGVSVTGYISSPTDVDWFKLIVTTPSTLAFALSVPAGKDYDLELYGPDGAYVRGSYNDTGAAENINHFAATVGTYHVRVYGYPTGNGAFSATSAYSLTANLTGAAITISWTGAVSTDWNAIDNWNLNRVPTADDTVSIPAGKIADFAGAPASKIVVAGTLNWTGGTITAALTIASGAVLNVSGEGQKTIRDNGSLTNFGTVNWSGTGGLTLETTNPNTVMISNETGAVFNLLGNATVNTYSSGGNWPATLRNLGTLRKSGNSSTSTISTPFLNFGTVQVQNGTLAFTASFTNNGSVHFDSSGRVTVNETTLTAPAITTQPTGQTVNAGTDASFTVATMGTVPLSYQWRKDGLTRSGATSASLIITNVQPADSGIYDVVVINGVLPNATSDPAALNVVPNGVSATHSIASALLNTTGGTITVSNRFGYLGPVTNLEWSVLLPAAWSFASSDAASADAKPAIGTTRSIEWKWATLPMSPVTFAYTINVPAGDVAPRLLVALVKFKYDGTDIQMTAKPDPLMAGFTHSADTDLDFRISLFELTRVIELYNTRSGTVRTGCYKIDATGEDGFSADAARAASASAVLARYHSADTRGATTGSARDGAIDLFELTRVIELYNTRAGTVRTGQYHVQAGTEDGFAAGP